MATEDLKMKLVEQVETYLNGNDWNFEYDDSHSVFKMGFSVKNKLKGAKIFIICRETGVSFWFVLNLSGDEATAQEVMEFLTRANYGLVNGAFEMDLDDYEIRYRIYLSCEDVPSTDLLDRQIDTGLYMLKRYGDELLAVLFGMKSAADAIKAAESSDKE